MTLEKFDPFHAFMKVKILVDQIWVVVDLVVIRGPRYSKMI